MPNRKYVAGATTERTLIKILESYGYACIRSAGSKKIDILAGKGNVKLGIEVKSTKKNSMSISTKTVRKVIEFCKKFGCKPLIVVKFNNYGFRVFDATKMQTCDNRTVKIKPNDGEKLEDYISKIP